METAPYGQKSPGGAKILNLVARDKSINTLPGYQRQKRRTLLAACSMGLRGGFLAAEYEMDTAIA
jgi:hypothetical protein